MARVKNPQSGRKKRKRKFNYRLLKRRRSYTTLEISDKLGAHPRTIQSWQKSGLKPLNPGGSPLLFMGTDVSDFLRNRQNSRKIKLGDGEFYCPRCKAARKSLPGKIWFDFTNRIMGKGDIQVLIKGICAECDCRLTLFSTQNRFKSTDFYAIKQQADKVLDRDSISPINTDIGVV